MKCLSCKNQASVGHKRCPACLQKARDYSKKRYHGELPLNNHMRICKCCNVRIAIQGGLKCVECGDPKRITNANYRRAKKEVDERREKLLRMMNNKIGV